MFSNGIIQTEWQKSGEGEAVLQHLLDTNTSGRKLFGLLEKPEELCSLEEVTYKVLFTGKSGVGKTLTISKLAGISQNVSSNSETCGIHITSIYWPVKIWEKVILFKLQCWEAGSNSSKKFTHINEACSAKTDLVVCLFSYHETTSLNDLPHAINSALKMDPNPPAVMVIGTRYSSSKVDVSKAAVKEFESKNGVEVLNMTHYHNYGTSEISRVTPILNSICEQLWIRDQQYIINNGITV